MDRERLETSAAALFELALEAGEEVSSPVDAATPVYRVLTVLEGDEDCTVYLSEQQWPVHRLVTLQVARPDPKVTFTPVEIASRVSALKELSAEGIARTYDGHMTAAGDVWLVGEYLRGPRLERYCDENHLPETDRVELCEAVRRAIERAHQKGVAHGRLNVRSIVVGDSGHGPAPIVTGFSACPRATAADDLAALERIREMVLHRL